jgi:hypothetical protein
MPALISFRDPADISRSRDRVYRAAGDNIGFRRGWRLTVTSGGVTTLYAGDGNARSRFQRDQSGCADSVIRFRPAARRVDEMATAPDAQVLAANNAETPACRKSVLHNNGHRRSLSPLAPSGPLTGWIPAVWSSRRGIRTGTFFVSIRNGWGQ